MVWRGDDPQGNEARKIAPFIVPYTRGRGLDLGCGPFKAFRHFIGVDNRDEYAGADWAPDVDADCTDLSLFVSNQFDFVFSSHLLEHLEDTEAVLAEWWRVIRPGGRLVLYLPHRDHYPNIGQSGSNPDHRHDFAEEDIIQHMGEVAFKSGYGWTVEENEVRSHGQEYSFFLVFRKSEKRKSGSPLCQFRPWRPAEQRCMVIRYGAIGDHMMVSSALPVLKEQGWHITYNCDPRGEEVMRHDPHIDAFWVQDKDQVPNHLLGVYWARLRERWPTTFNLCESVEGRFLPREFRLGYHDPEHVRRAKMGRGNYIDWTHTCLGVPETPHRTKFYPTSDEHAWARRERQKIGRDGPVLMYCLAGSARHKTWPGMDDLIHRLDLETDVQVVTVGAGIDAVLEQFDVEPGNIHRRVDKWSRRETLAFAQEADLVFGPETGVLNAVSMEPTVAKVVYLSHSNDTNLTRDWVNATVVLPPESVGCYPCHRLYEPGSPDCPKDENSHTALCAASIAPKTMFEAIMGHIRPREETAA